MGLLNLYEARKTAEEKLGFEIDDEVAKSVLRYSAKKCLANGYGLNYLAKLYENELTDYYMRLAVNSLGAGGGQADV